MILANFSLKCNSKYFSGISLSHGVKNMYQRIRDLREDADMTQKQMGEILKCSQRIYSNYERGDVDIPTQILIKLSEFHNTSVDYLLGLTDEKQSYPRKR